MWATSHQLLISTFFLWMQGKVHRRPHWGTLWSAGLGTVTVCHWRCWDAESYPAQYDADWFWSGILFLPHREFLLLTTEQKLRTVIHSDCLSHKGNELAINNKARKYPVSLQFCFEHKQSQTQMLNLPECFHPFTHSVPASSALLSL